MSASIFVTLLIILMVIWIIKSIVDKNNGRKEQEFRDWKREQDAQFQKQQREKQQQKKKQEEDTRNSYHFDEFIEEYSGEYSSEYFDDSVDIEEKVHRIVYKDIYEDIEREHERQREDEKIDRIVFKEIFDSESKVSQDCDEAVKKAIDYNFTSNNNSFCRFDQNEDFYKGFEKREDWADFKKVIDSNKVEKLYHFTDRANINSIKKHGLCSWGFCLENGIDIPFAGGSVQSRSLDKRDNLQNYVRVSFVRKHPMMYVAHKDGRINEPIILEISTDIVQWNTTKFSDRNATRNGARVGISIDHLKQIRFDLIKKDKHFDIENEDERHFYQAEVLALNYIPAKYITNLNKF